MDSSSLNLVTIWAAPALALLIAACGVEGAGSSSTLEGSIDGFAP